MAELEPGEVQPPPYALVDDLVKQRERIYGVTGSSLLTTTGQERLPTAGGSAMDIARRSKTIRNREIRLRRMLLVEPRIADAYAKTTQRVRAGQSLLADMALRIPAMLLNKPYQLRMAPVGDEDEDRDKATDIEKFVHAFLLGKEGQRAALDRGKTSIWRDFMDNLVSAGEGAFLLQERRDMWGRNRVPTQGQFQDDAGDTPKGRRRSAAQKYNEAITQHRRGVPPFSLQNLDPQMVYVVEDYEGHEDEAIIVANRPYRTTLMEHGLVPAKRKYGLAGQDLLKSGDGRRAYEIAPNGLGAPYPIRDFPTGRYQPESVQVVHYFCSAERAQYLGLVDGRDPDLGVWATYVDGVPVAWGGLWGPAFHPLPIFFSYGLSTAIPDPNYRGIPALMTLIELADLLDQIITMELHIAFWSAFPPVIEEDKSSQGGGATGLPGTSEDDPEAAQRPGSTGSAGGIKYLEPAKFYTVPPGKTWRYFVMPGEATVHLERLYTKAQQLFDLLGLPGVFRGQGGASQPGYAISQLLIAARSLFDPIVDNSTLTVTRAAQYLLWQIWRRFPEGISVYTDPQAGKDGWLTLMPDDIAPNARRAGDGVPWLECTVKAEPMLPVDESLMERRGQEAVQSGMVDRLTAREKYYNDPAPEETEARILAQKAQEHPVAIANAVYRALVRSGELLPELAVALYAKDFGVDPSVALSQLAATGALTPEQTRAVQQLLANQQAMQAQMAQAPVGVMGGPPGPPGGPGPAPFFAPPPAGGPGLRPGVGVPGAAPVGAPNLPPVAPNMPATGVPTPPAAPPVAVGGRPGGLPPPGMRLPPTQPTPQQRLASAVAH